MAAKQNFQFQKVWEVEICEPNKTLEDFFPENLF